jgi:hypothetical protein
MVWGVLAWRPQQPPGCRQRCTFGACGQVGCDARNSASLLPRTPPGRLVCASCASSTAAACCLHARLAQCHDGMARCVRAYPFSCTQTRTQPANRAHVTGMLGTGHMTTVCLAARPPTRVCWMAGASCAGAGGCMAALRAGARPARVAAGQGSPVWRWLMRACMVRLCSGLAVSASRPEQLLAAPPPAAARCRARAGGRHTRSAPHAARPAQVHVLRQLMHAHGGLHTYTGVWVRGQCGAHTPRVRAREWGSRQLACRPLLQSVWALLAPWCVTTVSCGHA